jgi:hypothetical protein
LARSKRSTTSLIMKLRLNSYVNSYMTLVWTSQKIKILDAYAVGLVAKK